MIAQIVRARIVSPIDNSRLQYLPKNTHPLARTEYDQGPAPASLAMDRMLLVLTASADRRQAPDELVKAQQDKASPQYHRWLTPQQFGEQFGAADTDIQKISAWLAAQGFQVGRVANGKNLIEFSGTAQQIQQAFHTSIHKYVVDGKAHWANSSDPHIPVAFAPLIAGISTLHDFRTAPQIAALKQQAAKVKTAGAYPATTLTTGEHALSPGDFGHIYSLSLLWGYPFPYSPSIAVVARTNINIQDVQDFDNTFSLPQNLPQVVLNGPDPGDLGGGEEAEAVLDASWSTALAPTLTVKLVVSQSTNSTDGVLLSEEYIVDNNLADVMTESFGTCEANFTQAQAEFFSSLAQQAAAQGITYTVAAGDSGAEGCDNPDTEKTATGPLSVNMLASTPYDIAVGGTQFNEGANSSVYWSSGYFGLTTASFYIPEVAWNESCNGATCGSAAGIWAGGGGRSILFAKPDWQTGVAGIPDDGARDLPDVSLTSAAHDFYLICLDGSCSTKYGEGYFAGIAGTSAATPSFAAIMVQVIQQTNSRQGQAAGVLYRLAANQNLAACGSATIAQAILADSYFSNCIFNDITSGNNAVPGETGYDAGSAAYQAGVGYDLATGLGSVNAYQLALAWNNVPTPAPQIRVGIESPSAQNSSVIGLATFSGWALADNGWVRTVAISVDSVPYGNATYGASRADICALYPAPNCSNVGWSFSMDTTKLAAGQHSMSATITTDSGQTYTSSSPFTVANWTSSNPMRTSIDVPNISSGVFSGTANFGGWAIDSLSAVSQVAVTIDGVSRGLAEYGGDRPDVCRAHPGEAGCPYVGWNFALDTTALPDGSHTIAVTSTTAVGQHSTVSANFITGNNPGNILTASIDQPGAQSGVFAGVAAFGGWAITTSIPISSVAVTIDGVAYGSAVYGGSRPDVCKAHPNRPACPNVGWNFALDTTKLINGQHVLGITAVAAGGQFATLSRAYSVSNPTPASPVVIGIDLPSPQNQILLGQNTFSGWALDTSDSIGTVSAAIDGSPYGVVSYGAARPDVCALYPGAPNCPSVGWSLPVDTTLLANGVHTLTVTAAGAQTNTLSATFLVSNWATQNPMKLSIDYPNSRSGPLSGQLGIGGWAIDQLAALGQVTVAVDNVPLGNAFLGGSRPDVCAVFANAIGCPNVGWNYYLDTTLFGDGAHTLAVAGTTTGGRSSTFTGSFEVANGSTSPLRVSIDIPNSTQTSTGTAAVGGWALDKSGAQIVNVEILVDGMLNGTAIYGGGRSDVCAHYSTAGGCPNVGWNYNLDTTPFANGTHTLAARATSADGNQYTVSSTFSVANQP